MSQKVIDLKIKVEKEENTVNDLSKQLENPQISSQRKRELKGEDPKPDDLQAKIHV